MGCEIVICSVLAAHATRRNAIRLPIVALDGFLINAGAGMTRHAGPVDRVPGLAPQRGEQRQTRGIDPALPQLRVVLCEHQFEIRRLGPVQPAQRIRQTRWIELERGATGAVLRDLIAID